MELTLNFAWMLLAMLMLWLWLSHTPRDGAGRGTQLVALAMLILILFPVISVTDDLMMAQNPAETDCCQRKAHICAHAHLIPHTVAALGLPLLAELTCNCSRVAAPTAERVAVMDHPATAAIQNRPPPTA
jgi:hypothetical protein